MFIYIFCNSCAYVALDTSQAKNNYVNPNLKSGIIFYLGKPGPMVRNKYVVKCFSKYAGVIVKEAELEWDSKSSLALYPGEYIIEAHVIYFKKKIWQSKCEIDIRDQEIVHYRFEPPIFVTTKPNIQIN